MKWLLTTVCLLLISFFSWSQNKFEFITWDKVSPKVKEDLKLVKTNKTSTLYKSIAQYKIDGLEDADISLAVLDMDKDGKPEYVLLLQGMEWCGTLGCSIEAYKDEGKKQIHLTDEPEGIKPAKNGIISSKGKLIPFKVVKL